MSAFIWSMPADGLIEMPPESNVMPLPTRATRGPVPACLIRTSRGGRCEPLPTPSTPPKPAAAQRVLVEHLDLETGGPAGFLGPPGELGRRQVVRRGVDQVAGERGGGGDDPGPAGGGGQLLGLGVGHQQGDQAGRGGLGAVAAAVRPERVRAEQRALGRRGGQLGDRAVAAGEPERAGDPGLAAERAHGRAGRPAPPAAAPAPARRPAPGRGRPRPPAAPARSRRRRA